MQPTRARAATYGPTRLFGFVLCLLLVCTPDGWVTDLHVKAYGPLPVAGYKAAPKYEYMIDVSTSMSRVEICAAHIDGAGYLWLCG